MPDRLERVAYLTGEYPRASDTFIQREVAALRTEGLEVLTCSIRATAAEHHVGPEQQAEARSTFNVLRAARNPLHLLRCHARALARGPRRYASALSLAARTGPKGLRGALYQLFYFAEAAVLAEHLHREGVQHLHNHIAKSSCSVAMIISEMTGIPFSFTLHGPDIFFAPEHWRLDAKIARARFVACISHFCRAQAMIFAQAGDRAKLHIVHCGVEPGRYAPVDSGSGGQDTQSAPRVLFVGRLATVKGLTVLFDALGQLAASHPHLHLRLVGDGPERATLEAEARALPHRVEFLGYRDQAAVAGELREADLLVLPSFAEGLPVVLMEALAASVPVVATRVAGVSELVEDGVSGRLVPPGDAEALAGAIASLLDTGAAARRAMGAAGRVRVVAEFDAAREARWLAALMRGYHAGDAPRGLRPPPEGEG